MLRNLFAVPSSTPIPLLRFDVGHVTMEEMIHGKKLNFLHHLKSIENESLAGDILNLQIKYGFPGLVSECRTLIRNYKLPNIIDGTLVLDKLSWKRLVREAILKKSEENIRKSFCEYSKLRNESYEDEELKSKEYIKSMKLRDSRTNFRIRSKMLKTKMNMKHNENFAQKLWKCDYCQCMDSQAHIIWCPAFGPLREGKDLSNNLDLVHYYQNVMKIREDDAKKK